MRKRTIALPIPEYRTTPRPLLLVGGENARLHALPLVFQEGGEELLITKRCIIAKAGMAFYNLTDSIFMFSNWLHLDSM